MGPEASRRRPGQPEGGFENRLLEPLA